MAAWASPESVTGPAGLSPETVRGLTAAEARTLERICREGPRARVAPTHARALLRDRLAYVVAMDGRAFWHLTAKGREARRPKGDR